MSNVNWKELHLEKIKLTNFKNYELEEITFSNRINCILGLNGMGKTNLLDAVYYLCMCKSHFGVLDRQVVRQGEDFFRLEGFFYQKEKRLQTVAKVVPRQQKTFELNQKPYERLSDHIGLLPVVMSTPYDLELVQEGSEVRRRFLDNTLSQIDQQYLEQLIIYNRVLKQRNALLKESADHHKIPDANLLEVLDAQLAKPALVIFDRRKQFVNQFIPVFQKFYRHISGANEKVTLTYRCQLLENQDFIELLKENRQKDQLLQRTTVGIHRDDLKFKIEEFPLKKFASQGQLKSFILSLKLAQYQLLYEEKQTPPVLLLDDIFDKLDAQRLAQLIRLLSEKPFGQVFLTDTNPEQLPEVLKEINQGFSSFWVEKGKIREMENVSQL